MQKHGGGGARAGAPQGSDPAASRAPHLHSHTYPSHTYPSRLTLLLYVCEPPHAFCVVRAATGKSADVQDQPRAATAFSSWQQVIMSVTTPELLATGKSPAC
eukprot:COSAG01_NODE_3307_length_6288_cov_62.023913_4_plen_102_part_00